DLAEAGGAGALAWSRFGMTRIRGQEGLTITEVVVVISIIGLLAAATLPMVGTAIGDAKVRQVAEQIGGAARRARQAALASAATYQFTMGGTTVGASCITDSPVGNICPASRTPDYTETIPTDVTVSPSPITLPFDPSGSTVASTFTVTSGSSNYQVTVNSAGRVRICTPICS